jgi:hypothetical protein
MPTSGLSIPERVVAFLKKHPKTPYCDDCIKENVQLKRRQQAQRVTGALATTHDFLREAGKCSECGDSKLVIRTN